MGSERQRAGGVAPEQSGDDTTSQYDHHFVGAAEPFERIAKGLDYPMIVVTTVSGDGVRAGCLVGFHTQSSISPPQYAVWISKANHTYRVVQQADALALHFLTEDDLDIAELFGSLTGDDIDKFERCS